MSAPGGTYRLCWCGKELQELRDGVRNVCEFASDYTVDPTPATHCEERK